MCDKSPPIGIIHIRLNKWDTYKVETIVAPGVTSHSILSHQYRGSFFVQKNYLLVHFLLASFRVSSNFLV